MQFSLLYILALVVQLYEPETICLSSNTANLLCSSLCFLLVNTGIPAFFIVSINDFLPFACTLSVIILISVPRLYAATMALVSN